MDKDIKKSISFFFYESHIYQKIAIRQCCDPMAFTERRSQRNAPLREHFDAMLSILRTIDGDVPDMQAFRGRQFLGIVGPLDVGDALTLISRIREEDLVSQAEKALRASGYDKDELFAVAFMAENLGLDLNERRSPSRAILRERFDAALGILRTADEDPPTLHILKARLYLQIIESLEVNEVSTLVRRIKDEGLLRQARMVFRHSDWFPDPGIDDHEAADHIIRSEYNPN
ncbi:MAG: hypothetical protein KGH72_02170 [Candidatus Micrarchaeota archaeon]|nr:hypothetical protein [Candidatus Micrarchaeota archaeon]